MYLRVVQTLFGLSLKLGIQYQRAQDTSQAFANIFRYDYAAALSDVRLPIRCINSDEYPTDVSRKHLSQTLWRLSQALQSIVTSSRPPDLGSEFRCRLEGAKKE